MDNLARAISNDPSFLKIFILFREASGLTIASLNERYKKVKGDRINWNEELRMSRVAIKDLRQLKNTLEKDSQSVTRLSIPDSLSHVTGISNAKFVEITENILRSFTELKSRHPIISGMQNEELYNLFFLSVTRLGLSDKQDDSGSDSNSQSLWDCLREAYEELLENKEALESCQNRCRNIWAAEVASLYATWLTATAACTALVIPFAQVVCAVAALASFTYWSHKASKAAEVCAEDCEELYS